MYSFFSISIIRLYLCSQINEEYEFVQNLPLDLDEKESDCAMEIDNQEDFANQKLKFSIDHLKIMDGPNIDDLDGFINNKIKLYRLNGNIELNNEDIKKILIHGVLFHRLKDNNLSLSIFRSFLTGSYQEIINDFCLIIRTSLIKFTLVNVLEEIDPLFIDKYFQNMQEFKEFMNKDNKKLLNDLNHLIYCENVDMIKEFIQNVFIYLNKNLDLNNIPIDVKTEDIPEMNQFSTYDIQQAIENMTELKYENLFKILKKFDNILFFKNTDNSLKYQHIREMISYLKQTISRDNHPMNFWYENSKVFFALNYLYDDFLNFCLQNITVCISNTKGDFIKFTSNSFLSPKEINLDFKEINTSEIFYNQIWKSNSHIIDFISTETVFLDFIRTSNVNKIEMNNFLEQELKQKKIIGIKCIEKFLDFHNNISNNKNSFLFCQSNCINYLTNETVSDISFFINSIYHFFIRYILRELFLGDLRFNSLDQKEQNSYIKFYDLLKIKIDHEGVYYEPLFQKINDDEYLSLDEKFQMIFKKIDREKIQEYLFIVENQNQRVELYTLEYFRMFNYLLMTGKTKELDIKTDMIIYGTIWSDFYHMIFCDKNKQKNFNKNNIFNFDENIFPVTTFINFSIFTKSCLKINFSNIFKFENHFLPAGQGYEIEFKDGCLTILNIIISIAYIPKNIKSFKFKKSFIRTLDTSEKYIKFTKDHNEEMECFFKNCIFTKKIIIECVLKRISLENCGLIQWMKIENSIEIDFLQVKGCIGNIELNTLQLFENSRMDDYDDRLLLYEKDKYCIIRYYKVYNMINSEFRIADLKIEKCEILASIHIKFEKMLIINSKGNFLVYFNSFSDSYFCRLIINEKSKTKIDLSAPSKKYIFENLTFVEIENNFFDPNDSVNVEFINCERITKEEEMKRYLEDPTQRF